ncbi:hypothetical protein V8F06_002787 [Rhypophila decipiens]
MARLVSVVSTMCQTCTPYFISAMICMRPPSTFMWGLLELPVPRACSLAFLLIWGKLSWTLLHACSGRIDPLSGRGRDLPPSSTHEPSTSTDQPIVLVDITTHIEATAPSSCCDPNIAALARSLFGETPRVSGLIISEAGFRVATVTCVDKTENSTCRGSRTLCHHSARDSVFCLLVVSAYKPWSEATFSWFSVLTCSRPSPASTMPGLLMLPHISAIF